MEVNEGGEENLDEGWMDGREGEAREREREPNHVCPSRNTMNVLAVGWAQSLYFLGPSPSVFFLFRTGLRFSLFQSLMLYKIDTCYLKFR